MFKKLPEPESAATHQLALLSVDSREIFALIDSGASHSLIDDKAYRDFSGEPIRPSDLSLKSVTGQSLELLGCGEVTFNLSSDLTVTHTFHVVKNLRPYEAILGLDFLASPRLQVHHDLSNFLLYVLGYPIRLFNSDREQPCSSVVPVTALGRHQYLSPHSVTFVQTHINSEEYQAISSAPQEHWEFHPHPKRSEDIKPLRCIVETRGLKEGLLIGVANCTVGGFKLKNDEPLGFLTKATTKPLPDFLMNPKDDATDFTGKEKDAAPVSAYLGSSETPQTHDKSGRQDESHENNSSAEKSPAEANHEEAKQPASTDGQKKFLEAFKYGDLTEGQLSQVQDLLWNTETVSPWKTIH